MNWKTKTFVISAFAGVLVGLASAYVIIKRAEAENALPKISPGDGVKLGLGIMTLLRLVSDIGEPD